MASQACPATVDGVAQVVNEQILINEERMQFQPSSPGGPSRITECIPVALFPRIAECSPGFFSRITECSPGALFPRVTERSPGDLLPRITECTPGASCHPAQPCRLTSQCTGAFLKQYVTNNNNNNNNDNNHYHHLFTKYK